MHRQIVYFTEMKPYSEIYERPDAYAVREDRPMVWLQKLCVKILDKIGARAQETLTTYNSVRRFDVTDIVSRIHQQYGSILDNYSTDIKTIVIGAEEFAELMNAPKVRYMMDFTVGGAYGYGKYMDVNIKVVPWMSGVVLVP